jgi:hypothetical protein
MPSRNSNFDKNKVVFKLRTAFEEKERAKSYIKTEHSLENKKLPANQFM